MKNPALPFALAGFCTLLQPAWAADSASKSQYHLFNPTPESLMRGFITDRPDRTESPISVDAGHFQLETDLVAVTRDQGETSTIFNFMNLKAGLTRDTDLQFVLESHVVDGSGSGVGDATVRYKYNLFGNDEGASAMALMPYVNLSSSEFGLIVPIGFDAPRGFGIGMMFQYDRVRDNPGEGYHAQFISSITAAHDLFWGLEGYIEFFSQTEADAPWVATLDGGLILPVGKQVRLDLGANVGVTEAANDINPFLGVSIRM
jgi:hypothetical protein